MEDLDVTRGDAEKHERKMGARHLGAGVVAVMSLKGTATLTAAYLLPTWPLRFLALAIIISIGTFGIVRHRRRKRDAERERSAS
jgi:hypothetical protein